MKRFERSNGLDTALYKNYLYLFLLGFNFFYNSFFDNSGNMTLLHIHQCTSHGNMRLASKKTEPLRDENGHTCIVPN